MEHMIVGSLLVVIIAAAGWLIGFYNRMTNMKRQADDGWRMFYTAVCKRDDLLKDYMETLSDSSNPGPEFLYGAIRTENSRPDGEIPCGIMAYSPEISPSIERLRSGNILCSWEDSLESIQLRHRLEELEVRIESHRQSYNKWVQSYNNSLTRFSNRIAGGILGVQRLPELDGLSIGQKDSSHID